MPTDAQAYEGITTLSIYCVILKSTLEMFPLEKEKSGLLKSTVLRWPATFPDSRKDSRGQGHWGDEALGAMDQRSRVGGRAGGSWAGAGISDWGEEGSRSRGGMEGVSTEQMGEKCIN